MNVYALVPWQVRLAFLALVLLLVVGLMWLLDSKLEEHYTAKQNALVVEDASRANAAALKRLEAQHLRDQQLLKDRGVRLAAARQKAKDQDDEMQRLKAAKPEVQRWAEEALPADVAARHRGVR